jgi:hypothetical protein
MATVTSSIQLRRHTGSSPLRPLTLNEGEFAIDFADNGHLYYGGPGSVTHISSSFTFNSLIITGSPTYALEVTGSTNIKGDLKVDGTGSFTVLETIYETASIIYSSGSTKFGDSTDDTHVRTGSMYLYNDLYSESTGSFSVVSASKYVGVDSTKYKTGSAASSSLLNLEILNFDSNVFITSDSASGKLIIQFGEANIPTTEFTRNNFDTNRFSLETDIYYITSSWDLVSGVTYLSHSFLTHINGQTINLSSLSNLNINNPLSHSLTIGGTSYPVSSGSYNNQWRITSSLHIIDGAGSYQDILTDSSTLLELNKTAPGSQNVTFNYTNLTPGGSNYVDSPTSTTADSLIERGVFGTMSINVAQINASNGWYGLPADPTPASTASKTAGGPVGGGTGWYEVSDNIFFAEINQLSTITSLTLTTLFTASYTSTDVGLPAIYSRDNVSTKAYKKIVTPRVGFSANSASLTEADLNYLNGWINGSEIEDGQVINFPTTNPNGATFSADVTTTSKYLYIIYSSSFSDLSAIIQSQNNVIDQFNSPVEVGEYKYYRSINKVIPPNTFTAELQI